MSNTLEVVDSLIVVPHLDHLVVAGGDEVLTLGVDGQSVELGGVGAIKHADGLTVEAVPVGDLAVGTGSQKL